MEMSLFCRHWQYELERHKSGKNPRLFMALFKTSWWRFIIQGILVTLEVRMHDNSFVVSISGFGWPHGHPNYIAGQLLHAFLQNNIVTMYSAGDIAKLPAHCSWIFEWILCSAGNLGSG